MLKRLLRHERTQALIASLIGRYLQFALATTRWRIIGSENYQIMIAGTPAIIAFWHEFLPLMPQLWLTNRPRLPGQSVHVLISRHRDGKLIADIIRRFHLDTIHGSSGQQRGGAAGVLALIDVLDSGRIACITPDGPRGPRREAKPGVAQLAALSGRPILPCAARTSWRITLGSWDRMALPVPFGRGAIVCGPMVSVPREDWEARLPAIEAALAEVCAEADRQCP